MARNNVPPQHLWAGSTGVWTTQERVMSLKVRPLGRVPQLRLV